MTSHRTPTEHTMRSFDGTELFYRAWMPAGPPRRAVLLFHRGHEHSGRWQDVVDALGMNDVAFFGWDARGHGRSPGPRGYAENVGVLVRDADWLARRLSADHGIPIEEMAILATSVGAAVAAAWLHDYAPGVRAAVLAAPAFRVKLYVPFAITLLRIRLALLGPGNVRSYVKARMLTHDPLEAERYRSDDLIFREIPVNVLLDLHDTSTRVVEDAGAIQTPLLLLAAGSDWVVRLGAERRFFERLSSPVKRMEVLEGFFHDIFHETDRARPIGMARDFLRERFAAPPLRPSPPTHTTEEYDRLSSPGGRAWLYAPARLALRTAGRLSEGIRLGGRTGFDSGATLDYVYENRPRGTTPIGRWIDRAYLESIGWRGIRVRRVHLRKLLHTAMERLHAEGRPVRILDVAAGPGRYVLETLHDLPQIPATALLRDCTPGNLEAGRRLAAGLGVHGAEFQLGDAFDRDSLASVRPKPTIAIVSGLYELFPENGPVSRSLAGIHDALEEGGLLLYTNQPWHPQVEFIARVLPNREGKPWIMRRRTQAEMDGLVEGAGFRKTEMEIDPWGIFTVSLAERQG